MDISTNNKAVYMTSAEFNALLDYSMSIPTGTIVGKRWRRNAPLGSGNWVMGEYFLDETIPADEIGIRWRTIIITDLAKPVSSLERESLPVHLL